MQRNGTFRMRVWEPFWKHYLVWMNRFIVACSNTYFFAVIGDAVRPPFLANGAIFLYSILLCMLLRWSIGRKRSSGPMESAQQRHKRPSSAQDADAEFRRGAEQTLKETFFAYLVNIVLGLLVCLYREQDFYPVMYGGIGLVAALFSPFGVGMMAATNVKTGRPDPALLVLGLCCIVPGVMYVLLTVLL